jgi:hypothetical protein
MEQSSNKLHYDTCSSLPKHHCLKLISIVHLILAIMHLPQLNNVLTVPVIATLVLSTPGAQALSTAASVIEGAKTLFLRIQRTGLNGMGVVNLYSAVKHYLKDGNAYDPDVENKFTLRMTTTDGGN